MNADKRGSMVQPLSQIKQENLCQKILLQRKGDEEKGALSPELGTFQLATADGGNSKPVWGTVQ